MTDIEMLQKEIQTFIDKLTHTKEMKEWAGICLKKLCEIAAPLGMVQDKKPSDDILQTPTADTVGDIVSRLGSELLSIKKLGNSYYRIMLVDPHNDGIKQVIAKELERKVKLGVDFTLFFTPGAKISGGKNENNTR